MSQHTTQLQTMISNPDQEQPDIMEFIAFVYTRPHLLLLSLAVCYLVFRVSQRFTASITLRRKAAVHGCEPVNGTGNKDPFLGIDFLLERTRHVREHTWLDYTYKRFTKRGLNTVELNMLGRKILYTTEPENLKAVHHTKFKSWGITPNRKQRVVPFIGEGIFTNDGQAWQHSRKLLRPSFDRSQVDILHSLHRHSQILLGSIPSDGSMVDLRGLFHRFSMNVATDFLLGDSSGAGFTFGNEFEEAFDRCLNKIGGGGKMMMLGPSRDPQYERDVKFVHESVDIRVEQIISQLSDASQSRHIFIQHLLSETRDRIRIRSELLNNLMAGRDTIASMLTNAWSELSKHSEAWAQLQEEVGKLAGAIPTYAQLQNMPYLRAVFNESMRLYPQLPENGRIALEDTVLPLGGGLDGKSPAFVPKGRVLMWGTYALHRRADIFGEDSVYFNPNRWLDTPTEMAIKPGWGFLAFGGGPRVCIGLSASLQQLRRL